MDYNNKPEGYYNNIRYEMLKYLPANPKKIIDIGCGDGSFGKVLKEETGAEVWGIEYMDEEAVKARNVMDKVYSGPCEEHIGNLPDVFFDVIYFNDVLEHLVDPYEVLKSVKSKLAPNGVVISSIPNVRHYKTFLKIVFNKDWDYAASGVMDKTHLRFFTGNSIKKMYEDAGYSIKVHEGINKTSSIRPYLYNIPFLFTHMDMKYLQYATVAEVSKK